jgi:hydroxyquinol 1,2-dioxygenase
LESDAVFGVRSSLVADWVRHEPGRAPDGSVQSEPFSTLAFDFVLSPAHSPDRQAVAESA